MNDRDKLILSGLGLLGLWALSSGGDAKPPIVVSPPVGPLPQPNSPAAVMAENITPTPTIGKLYQIKKGDNAIKLSAQALGVQQSSNEADFYARNYLPNSAWNWFIYAVQSDGAYSWEWPGSGAKGFPFAAFYPQNDNAIAAAMQGELPARRYFFGRSKNPNTGKWLPPTRDNQAPLRGPAGYGLLFFPPNADGDPDSASRNPSIVLSALGKTVQDLRDV